MRQRYFLIEPKYADPDVFCHFVVGSDRCRASIQIYADLAMLSDAAAALAQPTLREESPPVGQVTEEGLFYFYLTVPPHDGGSRQVRFRFFQDWLDDGAPFRADIRFHLTLTEAHAFSQELTAWCARPDFTFVWKGD